MDKISSNHRNIAMGIHLLTFGKFLIPLGNFILPLVLWLANSKKSRFINEHGRHAINFQLSMSIYTITLALLMLGIILGTLLSGGTELWTAMDGNDFPFTHNMGAFTGLITTCIVGLSLLLFLTILDFICTIIAAIKANDGERYDYPLTIPFIGKSAITTGLEEPDVESETSAG